MIALPSIPKNLSLEDFLKLPETKPASEYINGQIEQKTMPQGKHSVLQGKLVTLINQQLESKQLGYAFPELRCTFADRSIVPDIAIFKWDNIPLDKNGEIADKIAIAPDWIIEILSPDQSAIKPINKIIFTLKNGGQLGWLISPQERIVLVFQGDKLPHSRQGNEPLTVLENFGNWQLSVSDVFQLLNFSQGVKA
ncbi:MAG: Uma2 family endonuclease [Microcystaceae cyanobacterium]